jgi:serine/threonine protein kinase
MSGAATCAACGAPIASSMADRCPSCRVRIAAAQASDDIALTGTPIGQRISLPDAQMYRVVGSAKGGMGRVLFCENPMASPPDVALKSCTSDKPGPAARFRWEARAWIALGRHPNIVQAYHVFRQGGRDVIAMQWVRGDEQHGADLCGWIYGNGLDTGRALNFAMQICDGMRHADASFQGLGGSFVHRDLKPANLLVAASGELKITDFGIVQPLGDAPRERAGTAGYMSPEQWRGEPLDTRSDIYSFGCVLFEMLAKRLVFPSTPPDDDRLLQATPSHFRADVPPRLDRLVVDCLRKPREERPANFTVLRRELEQVARDYGVVPPTAAVPPPPTVDDLERRALSLVALGLSQDALGLLERETAWDALAPNDRARLLECRGLARTRAGDLGAGVQELSEAVEMRPRSWRARLYLGEALVLGGSLGPAEEQLGRAVAIDRSLAAAYIWLSHLHLVRGEFERAGIMAGKAFSVDSDSGDVRAYRALAFLRDPQWGTETAEREVDEGITSDPTSSLAYIVRACIRRKRGDLAGAADDLLQADSCMPQREHRALATALLAACRGDRELARSGARECRKMPVLAPWRQEIEELST